MVEPGRAGGFVTAWVAVVLAVIAASCGSDTTTVVREDGRVSAVVTGPVGVSAVVIDFTSVSDIDVEGGDVFTSAAAGGTRAVIVLHSPGQLRVLLTPASAGERPTATLVDVSDASYQPANLAVFNVVVES